MCDGMVGACVLHICVRVGARYSRERGSKSEQFGSSLGRRLLALLFIGFQLQFHPSAAEDGSTTV